MMPYKFDHIPSKCELVLLKLNDLIDRIHRAKRKRPFNTGDKVRALFNCYNAEKGKEYIIEECFASKGPDGWHWWVYLEGLSTSHGADRFILIQRKEMVETK